MEQHWPLHDSFHLAPSLHGPVHTACTSRLAPLPLPSTAPSTMHLPSRLAPLHLPSRSPPFPSTALSTPMHLQSRSPPFLPHPVSRPFPSMHLPSRSPPFLPQPRPHPRASRLAPLSFLLPSTAPSTPTLRLTKLALSRSSAALATKREPKHRRFGKNHRRH